MTDKEQIIINGVTYYKQQDINEGLDEEHYITEFHLLATHYNLLLEDYARKTQKCEELKSESFTRESLISMQEKDIDRYRKTLEEVEKYIKEECNCECTDCLEYSNCKFQDILDIINKVKGAGNGLS